MNRVRLQQYEEKKNKLQFPLKLNEYNIKLSYDKKKKECKSKCQSLTREIINKYIKNKKTINYLSDYIDKITTDVFKDNLFPKEKNILENLETNINMIKDYGEQKKKLYMYDREDLEDKLVDQVKTVEMNQNKKFEHLKKETKYYFNLHDKINEDFLDTKKRFRSPMDNFEYLIHDNRHLNSKLEIIKRINLKLKEIYKKEKKYNLKLIQMGNLKNNKKKGNDGKGKEVNDDKKTNDIVT